MLYLNGYSWQEFVDQDNPSSVLFFIVSMASLPALGVPITPFYLYAGVFYPYPKAFLVCGISIFLNMVVSYGIAHTSLAGVIRSILKKQNWINRLMDKNNHLNLTLTLRIIPGIPYVLQNYAIAIAGVPFLMYIIWSMAIQSLYMAAWLYIGNAGAEASLPKLSVALIVLLLLFVLTRYLCKRMMGSQAIKP